VEKQGGQILVKRILEKLLPRGIVATAQTIRSHRILSFELGQYRTIRRWECVDRNGSPIPWYTYPAIEYLKQLDFADKTVFEYGSGYSTVFWARRCKKLVSIEDDEEWYERIAARLPDNVDYYLLEDREEYIKAIEGYPDGFDIVIIDGSHRMDCAVAARKRLKNDGFVILDNSDWTEQTSQFLRESDLIEVDMSGFGPINPYTWTTSFYFSRNVKLTPAHERQPIHGIGSLHYTEASQETHT
jgi:hypothetical protein